jgi:hypothetical protein
MVRSRSFLLLRGAVGSEHELPRVATLGYMMLNINQCDTITAKISEETSRLSPVSQRIVPCCRRKNRTGRTTYASNCIYRVWPDPRVELLCQDVENLLLCQPPTCAFGGPNFDQLYASNPGRDHISVLDLNVKGQPLWTHRDRR